MKQIDVVIGLVCRANQLLICQRRTQDPLGGLWEFPGGKLERGESREHCLARELAEELDIRVRILRPLPTIEYEYSSVHVRLHPYLCAHLDGEPKPLASQQLAWVAAGDLSHYTFPAANAPLLGWLAEHLNDATASE